MSCGRSTIWSSMAGLVASLSGEAQKEFDPKLWLKKVA